jgi:hypothetical protein
VGVDSNVGAGVGDEVEVGDDLGVDVAVGLTAVVGVAVEDADAGVVPVDRVPASALASSRICIERGANEVIESAL